MHSSPAAVIQFSSCASPCLTYSPLAKEQHSRRSSSWLKSCTFMKEKSCMNSLRCRKGGTSLAVSSARRRSSSSSSCPHELISDGCELLNDPERPCDVFGACMHSCTHKRPSENQETLPKPRAEAMHESMRALAAAGAAKGRRAERAPRAAPQCPS